MMVDDNNDKSLEEQVKIKMEQKKYAQVSEFNYILGQARRKEISDWIRNCHSKDMITKQELEDRLSFLEENWEERLT